METVALFLSQYVVSGRIGNVWCERDRLYPKRFHGLLLIKQLLLVVVVRHEACSITAQVWMPIEKNSTSAYVAKSFCAELNIVFNVNVTK